MRNSWYHPLCALALLGPVAGGGVVAQEAAGGVTTPGGADDHERCGRAVLATEGLLAYWRFEDSLDPSDGETPGQAVGNVAFDDSIVGGRALRLSGDGAITYGSVRELDVPETTIELLFRAQPSPAGGNPCLIAKRSASDQTRFSIHVSADLARLAVWNGSAVGWVELPEGFGIGSEGWHHLAVTNAQSRAQVYLDGIAYAGAVPFSRLDGLSLQIGAPRPQPDAEAFAGWIDEVAIYGRALTAQEIAAHVDAAGEAWAQYRLVAAAAAEELRAEQARIEAERLERHARLMEERMNAPDLMSEGEPRIYRGENLTAIAFGLGGIGAGAVYIDGRAARPWWLIFNHHAPIELPESLFAIRTQRGDDVVVRGLQTTPAGPFEPVHGLSLQGEYPFAWYTLEDDALPVQCSLEAFSPLVPLNSKDSAIPCAIFAITARNASEAPVSVALLATQQNAVGYRAPAAIDGRRAEGYGSNRNRVTSGDAGVMLHMTSDTAAGPAAGDMALVGIGGDLSGAAGFTDLAALHAAFAADGVLHGPAEAGPSAEGSTLSGAVASSAKLAPGESLTATFILTWHFPDAAHGAGAWTHAGNMYTNWWASAQEVARYVADDLVRLTAQTRLYHDTLYAGNLPYWLRDRLSSQVAILRSKTCYWAKNGYFGAWEGCGTQGGCCHGNCTHVWHYAQAHARLFPDIARLMREQTFGYQLDDGGLPHRHPDSAPATDGQLGEILGVYREHLCSADGHWLRTMWPRTQAAMDHAIRTWDADEDGVLAGAQWNTLDGNLGGSTSWIGTLYLAALGACEKMALLRDDPPSAERYARIRASGARLQNETLWNGEYYIQIPDPEPQHDYGEGCAIDQLLGEWWARQVGVESCYPQDRVQTALRSLLKYNFRPDFMGVHQAPRKFVADEDAGLQMIQWPHSPRPEPCILYGDEVMTGFEYAAAGAMVQSGMLEEGFMVAKAIADRYDGRRREGLTPGDTASWGYSGNPFGDDECGKFYGRAMSVWSLLPALQGFIYDGPAGVIGFAPTYRPDNHQSFFTSAEGWGLFTQTLAGGALRADVDVRYGRLWVNEIRLTMPDGGEPTRCEVRLDDELVDASLQDVGGEARIQLRTGMDVTAGRMVHVEVEFRA